MPFPKFIESGIEASLSGYFKIVDLLIHPPIKIKYTIRYCTANLCVCSHTRVCVHTRSCVCVHTHPLEGPWSGSSSRMLRSLLWRLLPLVVCARAARVWLARDRIFNMVVVLVLPLIILK